MGNELKRRLVHVLGAFPLGLYYLDTVTWDQLGYLYMAGSLLVVGLEVGRLAGWFDWWFYDQLIREYERENLGAYALFVFSSTIVVLLFESEVAVPAVLILALADPISGHLGSSELKQVKQTYVLLIMFGISTIIAVLFVPPLPAVMGGAAAAAADGVKPVVRGYVIDDDLTIAPAAAVAMTAGLTLPI